MAVATFMSPADQFARECKEAQGTSYLEKVSRRVRYVSRCKDKRFTLKSPKGAVLRIAELEDTIYRDNPEKVDEWGKFYLPNIVNMLVVGVVEGTSSPCDELVLMTCEDKQLYAYDGEELHLVASSLDQLPNIEYPSSKSYYNGEAFKDMTEQDWSVVKNGAVGKALDQEHRKLVQANKSAFLKCLK